jgi:hypothetical protein
MLRFTDDRTKVEDRVFDGQFVRTLAGTRRKRG